MPPRRLTEKQRAEVLRGWWAAFPYGSNRQRQDAINNFEHQYGPLTEVERRSAMFRWSPGDKARLGITKQFLASTDIGEEAARKLCGQLLDDSHYDLLLNEHGLVE